MKRKYHVIEGRGKSAQRALAAFCRANGQMLLPLVELIEQARLTGRTVAICSRLFPILGTGTSKRWFNKRQVLWTEGAVGVSDGI